MKTTLHSAHPQDLQAFLTPAAVGVRHDQVPTSLGYSILPVLTWEHWTQTKRAFGRGDAADDAVEQEADLLPFSAREEKNTSPCKKAQHKYVWFSPGNTRNIFS